MIRRSVSLRSDLTRRLALALFAVALVGTFVAYQLGSRYGNNAYDRALADDVRTLANHVTVVDGALRVDLPNEALKWLLADEGEPASYRVTDLRTGKVVEGQGELGPISSVQADEVAPVFRNARIDQRRMRVGFVRRMVASDHVPALIEIGEPMLRREQMTESILVGALVFMAITIVVAIGMVWHGVGGALVPLKILEAEAESRSGADLAPLDPMNAPEEVRGLIVAINSMMARVSSTMQSQSHFIANAAHQLRTPLSGLRLQLQLGLKAHQLDAIRERLTEAESSAVRACDLVEKLLVLAKAESSDSAADREPVDFSEIAHQVVDRFLALADEKSVDLGVASSQGKLLVKGNAFLFAELLGNLVDNAIRHGRRGGRVTIELGTRAANVVVAVSDDGPGFAEIDTDQLFTRFYQHDASSRTGSGLGLAIVHEIAERYSGKIAVTSTLGQGSRFELLFPLFRATGSGASRPAAA